LKRYLLKTLSDGRSEQTQKVFENLRLKKLPLQEVARNDGRCEEKNCEKILKKV
jgi:hypothetical protein